MITLSEVKPPAYYRHYSNPDCQGTLLKQTNKFPKTVDDTKFTVESAYDDRLAQWDYKLYEKACSVLSGRFENSSETEIKEFCRIVFKKKNKPVHFRIVYYFNVSTGYDCPRIDVIFKKETK